MGPGELIMQEGWKSNVSVSQYKTVTGQILSVRGETVRKLVV